MLPITEFGDNDQTRSQAPHNLIHRPKNLRKHCRSGYHAVHSLTLTNFMLDMMHGIFPALY